GFARRIGAVVVVVEPSGEPLRAVPQQRVAAQDEVVRPSPGGDRVHPGEVEAVGARPSGLPLHLVLGDDDAAFVADDGGVVRVLDGAARGARVPGNGGAPATPFAPGERVEARSGKRGRTARQRTAGAVG